MKIKVTTYQLVDLCKCRFLYVKSISCNAMQSSVVQHDLKHMKMHVKMTLRKVQSAHVLLQCTYNTVGIQCESF